jgi:two-component system, chemotaxis family, protein-glutamate methylesterase/glutaminase
MRRDIVVVGASAGGVEALERLVAGLREPLGASLFVVLHVSSQGVSVLPMILNRAGPLRAAHAVDGEPIEPGRIYVAPPNAHLLLEPGRVRLGVGPPENGHRPAIDPLFRSAAYVYRSRVQGVVLSGALDDGTAGLWAIKRRAGVAIVQDPADAAHDGMPRSALENVAIDHVLKVDDIGPLIMHLADDAMPAARPADGAAPALRPADDAALAARPADEPPPEPPVMADNDERLRREVALAADPTEANRLELPYGVDATPAALSCPSCHGTLWEIQEDKLVRYRCQVGHAFSGASLWAAQSRDLEEALWAACRTLEENATLSRRLAARAGASNLPMARAQFEAKAQGASERAALIRRALLLTNAASDVAGEGMVEADEVGSSGGDGAEGVAQPAPRARGDGEARGASEPPGEAK